MCPPQNIDTNLLAQAPTNTGIMTNLSSTRASFIRSIGTTNSNEDIMAKKSALQKIEDHEKLCRIMQKQTFEQIKEMKERIKRIEYMIVAGMGSLVLALLMNLMK